MKIKIKKSILKQRVKQILRENSLDGNIVKNPEIEIPQAWKRFIEMTRKKQFNEYGPAKKMYNDNGVITIVYSDGTGIAYQFTPKQDQIILQAFLEGDELLYTVVWNGQEWKTK